MAIQFLKKPTSVAPKGSPKYLLHKHLNGPSDGRSLSKVHASELTKPNFCPRKYALSDVEKVPVPDEWLSTSEEITFQIGRDLQDRVAHWFADMGIAMGDWACNGCKKLHVFQPRPVKCTSCGCRSFKHEEVRFQSAVTGADCGVDLLLKLDKPKLTPLEIKTIRPEDFATLVAPMAEHKQRTTLYLRNIAESTAPNASLVETEEAIVFYVSKGGYGKADEQLKEWGIHEKFSPIKEYRVKRDDKRVEREAKLATVVKDFRAGLVGMPCGICSTAFDKNAVGCPAKKPCWSGEHPAEYDWMAE